MPSPSPIVVVGASGGLGASSLALATGRRLAASGPPTVVVDLDLAGGGLDVSAGVEHLPGRRWSGFTGARGHLDADTLVQALPSEEGCHLLSAGGQGGGVDEDAVVDVLDSLLAGPLRVVVDLPRSSPLLERVVTAASGGLVVLLAGLRTRCLADADALVAHVLDGPASTAADVRLVTRGARPTGDVLDDVVAHLGVGHVHHVPVDVRVARDAERGLWPGTGRDAVRAAAEAVVACVDAVPVAS